MITSARPRAAVVAPLRPAAVAFDPQGRRQVERRALQRRDQLAVGVQRARAPPGPPQHARLGNASVDEAAHVGHTQVEPARYRAVAAQAQKRGHDLVLAPRDRLEVAPPPRRDGGGRLVEHEPKALRCAALGGGSRMPRGAALRRAAAHGVGPAAGWNQDSLPRSCSLTHRRCERPCARRGPARSRRDRASCRPSDAGPRRTGGRGRESGRSRAAPRRRA